MLAITLHEPWATLIARGDKAIETRGWTTRYRGPLAIHASKSDKYVDMWPDLWFDADRNAPVPPPPSYWPHGEVIAIVDLVGVQPTESLKPSAKEKAFGDFSPGRFGWLLQNVRPVVPGVMCRGMRMLWMVPSETKQELKARLCEVAGGGR